MARSAVTCTANTWVLALSNVTTQVAIVVNQWTFSDYLYTYVAHSGAAPTDNTTASTFPASQLLINSSSAIDVYVKCIKQLPYGTYNAGTVFADTSQIYGVK